MSEEIKKEEDKNTEKNNPCVIVEDVNMVFIPPKVSKFKLFIEEMKPIFKESCKKTYESFLEKISKK